MEYKLNNEIAKRKSKSVYKEDGKTIKLFIENYSKAAILNEALIQSRVEESTDLNIPKLIEVSKINNRWALVSEHIDGTPLDVLMQQNPDKEDEYLEMFVKLQLEVLSKTVPLLSRIKDKYKRKLTESTNLEENIKFELLHRLEGMKNHVKLCHGDFNPSNVIVKEDGSLYIIDWSHATQGNASADAAKTFLIFSMQEKVELADKYLDLFAKESTIEKNHIQRWIPIVAGIQKAKEIDEEQDFLNRWIDIYDYE
ncbi:MAG: aminoglycoside phosphotransferase [Clostridiales bacterium]|nr:aminoglycoside phosphotransferase [Clostridiales bacterium]